MDIALQILSLFGGLGMFLFGMNTMSTGLERAAGDKLRQIMEKVTGNLFKSVILGAVVAALTQSSSATTVMVVGFVNAGILTLSQAVGIIRSQYRYHNNSLDSQLKRFTRRCLVSCHS